MVGSANYDDENIAGEVNQAFVPHDSGGILTPLTYSLVLQRGDSLITPIDDGKGGAPPPIGFQPASVTAGPVPATRPVNIRDALGRGLQSAAVRAMALAGSQSFINLVGSIGIADFDQRVSYGGNQTVVSARVSPLEVAQAYATLAAGGVARSPVAIGKVLDPAGRVVDASAGTSRAAIDPGIAYLITSVLADPTYRLAAGSAPSAAAKYVAERSATSDDLVDAWMAGYTANLAVVVWVGNSNGRALASGDAAALIWRDLMDRAVSLRPATEFPLPSDVAVLSLCKNPACSTRQTEFVLQGTEKAALAANAAAIAEPTAVASNSRTPLVDRSQTPIPVATVTSLQPAAVTARRPGSLVTVPDVSQTTPDQARSRLTAVGLAIAPLIQYQSSAQLAASKRSVAVGQVVATAPAAGQQVAAGTGIVLIVRRN
jgi:membrane peptidoglycan carboxypeptidase